jgi:ABC-type spermidine/putrescine transport system permease subunit I
MEEAAATLGASRLQTFSCAGDRARADAPALLTGFALAFARALGEYGSVVFISGNMPMHTEVVPLLIMTKLEQFDYAGATAIALVMLTIVVRDAASVSTCCKALERRAAGGLTFAMAMPVRRRTAKTGAAIRPPWARTADRASCDGPSRAVPVFSR